MIRNPSRLAPAFFAAAATLCIVPLAGTAQATIVGAKSYGNELAGGEITVTYGSGGTHTETIQDGGGTLGFVSAAGFFDFSMDGDTFVKPWELTNQNSDFIVLVEFDLTNAGVLFDDDSGLVNTMNGYAGRDGAVQVNVSPPTITGSDETDFWSDPMNTNGDEWVMQYIEYLQQDFRNGLTSVWRDDTDIIGIDTGPEAPEPTSAVLMMLGACALLGRRRRR